MKYSPTGTRGPVPESGHIFGIVRILVVMLCAFVVLLPSAIQVSAQDAQAQPTEDPAQLVPNDPLAPQNNDENAATPTEEPAADVPVATQEPDSGSANQTTVTRSAQRADPATGPGFPAALAHGLAYVTGDDLVWQVRETEFAAPKNAKSSVSNASTVLQREGASIIRNDVTGKRAKTDPGEGYFIAAGDGYTLMAEDDSSLVWIFELVDPDDVAVDAFYESPVLDDLDEGVYDMTMMRYVLQPGDQVTLPEHNSAALVMVSSGEVEVNAGGDRSALAESDGQTLDGDATLSNTSNADAVVMYTYLGDEVSDDSAGTGTGTTPSTTGTSDSTTSDAGTGTTDDAASGTLQDEAAASTGENPLPETDEAGNFLTSIDVTADADIYLIITVDGLTVFDGTLPAGASSGPVVGTNFQVYTSSGVNTNFTNACGEYFKMGYEEGEVTYVLTATAESCAP